MGFCKQDYHPNKDLRLTNQNGFSLNLGIDKTKNIKF
jgi:hypothetical protein